MLNVAAGPTRCHSPSPAAIRRSTSCSADEVNRPTTSDDGRGTSPGKAGTVADSFGASLDRAGTEGTGGLAVSSGGSGGTGERLSSAGLGPTVAGASGDGCARPFFAESVAPLATSDPVGFDG